MSKTEIMNDLNKIMDAHSLSIGDIAEKMNVSFMTVYRWKHGLAAPKSRLILEAYQKFTQQFPLQ